MLGTSDLYSDTVVFSLFLSLCLQEVVLKKEKCMQMVVICGKLFLKYVVHYLVVVVVVVMMMITGT